MGGVGSHFGEGLVEGRAAESEDSGEEVHLGRGLAEGRAAEDSADAACDVSETCVAGTNRAVMDHYPIEHTP